MTYFVDAHYRAIYFFIVAPFVLAIVLPPVALYPVLLLSSLAGIVFLNFTVGFCWSNLFGSIHIIPAISLGLVVFMTASLLC